MKKSVLLWITVAVICCTAIVGNTVAWLVGRAEVNNTFVAGDIAISLTETTGNTYPLIPGTAVAKDPKVTVHRGSEACWLFVKVNESADLDTYISYTPADGWTALQDGVYYRVQSAATADVTYSFLQNDQVTVKENLTEAQMSALKASGAYPTLKLTAYAVQQSGIATVEQAWEQAAKLS
ncbi:MAG: hypothetical protein IJW16_00560 [Clostridia bacterium]|nr:hypothetical protein [Clostridia bacterium]